MKLTYNELKKRDVINITDGKCLGRIKDITLSFPKGILVGITVPGNHSKGILSFFDRSRLYIEVSRITKIGNDVILVNLNCGNERGEVIKPPPEPPCCPPCINVVENIQKIDNEIEDY